MCLVAKRIDHLFIDYLSQGLDKQVLPLLSKYLSQEGFTATGKCLELWMTEEENTREAILEWGEFGKRKTIISSVLPEQAEAGDIWFDPIEIKPMILVLNFDGAENTRLTWVSIRPIYNWQYNAFLHLVKWQVSKKYFLKADDLMSEERNAGKNLFDVVSNVYHEEAMAYAHWFGKKLIGKYTIKLLKSYFAKEQLEVALPANYKFWDGAEFSKSEFLRIANSIQTVDNNTNQEFNLLESNSEEYVIYDKTLFDEWENSSKITFNTCVMASIGLIKSIPINAYEFSQLLNQAPR